MSNTGGYMYLWQIFVDECLMLIAKVSVVWLITQSMFGRVPLPWCRWPAAWESGLVVGGLLGSWCLWSSAAATVSVHAAFYPMTDTPPGRRPAENNTLSVKTHKYSRNILLSFMQTQIMFCHKIQYSPIMNQNKVIYVKLLRKWRLWRSYSSL